MVNVQSFFSKDAACEVSLAVVEEVAPHEKEVALGFLEPLIEMAEEGDLIIIDPRDPGGGFGASDPLFVTIVPVVVQALQQLNEEDDAEAVWSQLAAEIKKVALRIGSKRALEHLPALESAIRRSLELFTKPRSV